MRRIAAWLAAFLFLPGLALAQGYQVLDNPQPTQKPGVVEVYEFFSYACPHCFTFRPRMEAWLEQTKTDVEVTRVPVVFRPSWEPLAKAYYAAEALGARDKIHQSLFEAIHVDKRNIQTEAQVTDFFVEQGLERDKVKQAFRSFAVDMKLRKAKQLAADYRVMSTPSVAVEGKYVLNPSTAGGQEGMLAQLDALVAKQAK